MFTARNVEFAISGAFKHKIPPHTTPHPRPTPPRMFWGGVGEGGGRWTHNPSTSKPPTTPHNLPTSEPTSPTTHPACPRRMSSPPITPPSPHTLPHPHHISQNQSKPPHDTPATPADQQLDSSQDPLRTDSRAKVPSRTRVPSRARLALHEPRRT